jgi:hypothetical protein
VDPQRAVFWVSWQRWCSASADGLVSVRNSVNWDLQHRKSAFVIRLLLAVLITVVVVVLCAAGRWWGLVFVVPLIVDLYLLRRIVAAGSGR